MANPTPPSQPLALTAPTAIGIQGGNQPNWNKVSNALNALGRELPLIANANPAVPVNEVNAMISAVNAQNIAVIQALNGMLVSLNAINVTLANHTATLQSIQHNSLRIGDSS